MQYSHAGLPTQPFFTSPGQRVALARERFFEQGERPTGLVSESVIQSWSRCLAAHRNPQDAVDFDPVTRSRLHGALTRSRQLLAVAAGDIRQLEAALAGTGARVLLTDATGVIVHSTPPQGTSEPVLGVVGRVGVCIAEQDVGTNAPAMVVKTGEAVTVLGAEHYFQCVQTLHCAAAPIRDGRGHLAGVLDLTVEARPFAFDAAALVGVYATLIENRLLQATAAEHLVLQFQVCGSMLGSALEALVGIDGGGRLAWHNGTAQKLLGLGRGTLPDSAAPDAQTLFGATLAQLEAHSAHTQAKPLRLPNGLTVWLRARAPGSATAPAAELPTTVPASTPAEAEAAAEGSTLQQSTHDVIAHTLADCGGNISLAARKLGVSRGLLYRRLRNQPVAAPA